MKTMTNTTKITKRTDYISWDQYFMGVSLLSAQRSKDPNTQVGACIVDPDNKVIGIGYNGLPKGCSDDEFPWEREGAYADTKYAYISHAELNAILNSSNNTLKGSSIYVSLFPCNECAKAIIQSGIREVVYMSDKYKDTDIIKASKRLLNTAGITLRNYKPTIESLSLDYRVEE
jgi:dCMP deaminase